MGTHPRFASLALLVDAATDTERGQFYSDGGNAWAGGSHGDARALLREGDTRAINDCEQLLDRYTLALAERLPGLPERTPSTWGTAPRVGAYLSGDPLSMYRTLPGDEPRPIRVWLDLFAAGSFELADIRARGVAALALCLSLSRVQPVQLMVGTGCRLVDASAWAPCPMDDLSTLSAALSPLVARRLIFPTVAAISKQKTAVYARTQPPEGYAPGDVWTGCATYGMERADWIAEYSKRYSESLAALAQV